MDNKKRSYIFENGLVLLFEETAWRESFAIGVSVPAGSVWDDGLCGLASMTCEMSNRGAGNFDNRRFLEELEKIGVKSSENATKLTADFVASGLVENWERTLELLALQIREANFPEEEFDSCRQIQLQEVASEQDDPDRRATIAFNNIFLPGALGRPTIGTEESIARIALDDIRRFHDSAYCPNGTIIAIAGRIDWENVKSKVGELFADWAPVERTESKTSLNETSNVHVQADLGQTSIRLGYRDVPRSDPNYLRSLGGVNVLSGGMSSRLFTEVREKRGLCYSVDASHCTLGEFGYVVCSCGTTSALAQDSLNVIVNEIDRLRNEPITENELERVKIRMKSSLVMQSESSMRIVGSMVGDWRSYRKIVPVDEKLAKVNALTCAAIEDYYANLAPFTFRLATLGPNALSIEKDRLF